MSENTAVNIDPRTLNASALGGVNSQEARVAICRIVINALREHGATTMKGRHRVDDLGLGTEIWPQVRALPCLGGRNVEQEFAKWPASGSAVMSLGALVKVLLTASDRRAALEQELRALDALADIQERHAPDPTIALRAKLALQFPAADYDPTGAMR